MLRKMAVGGAVAWTAPLITKTAFAAGPTSCVDQVIDFNTFTSGAAFTSATAGGITMTLGPAVFIGGTTALSDNRTIRAAPIGGINSRGLRFNQNSTANGGQEFTLSFSQAVYSVSFTITDIDTGSPNWSDRVVVVSPTAYTFSFPSGSTVIGAGTASGNTPTTGPFRNTATSDYPNTSPGGNVVLTFAGPLTALTVQFLCANEAGSSQSINLSNISFCG